MKIGEEVYIHGYIDETEISNDLEEIYNAIWDVDIPSPMVPEYREHHEQMVELMRLVKGKIEKYEVKNEHRNQQ